MTTSTTTNCYTNFVNYIMASTGLPLSQMQPFGMWVANRKNEFDTEVASALKIYGFENWLNSLYGE